MFDIKPVFLWTDILIYMLVFAVAVFIVWARKYEHLRAPWRQVLRSRFGVMSGIILFTYLSIGFLDSIHFRYHDSSQVNSLLDVLVSPLGQQDETTYSAPFAGHSFSKSVVTQADGSNLRDYPALKYVGVGGHDIAYRLLQGELKALGIWLLLITTVICFYAQKKNLPMQQVAQAMLTGQGPIPWRTIFMTSLAVLSVLFISFSLATEYHILGTDKVGEDVFYQALKSIRTGLVIGTLTTLVMLPFAVLFGMMAGYFRGIVDDVIQYVYTTLSSIPGILLIAAAILSLQIFITNHGDLFPTLADRADARLLALCIILGVTSWTSLCRLLRAETLKLREMDYVTASRALGVNHFMILFRHILPNVMHIILITVVLDFSALVLAEAVLSYVGVGVDPSTFSWGNMINGARLELAREPIVWWPLLAAFFFMFVLVLSANLFSDAVRDAFDPRLRQR